jgi:hypothetical protein
MALDANEISNTCVALFAEAEGLEHTYFHVVPRTDHPAPPSAAPSPSHHWGGDTATQLPGQVRDQITSKLAASATLRALPGRWDEGG